MAGLLAGGALLSLPALGQRVTTPQGEYMDTTRRLNPKCPGVYPYYYSVKLKYPRSSATLRAEAQAFLRARGGHYAGSGYITFRFVVDCEGRPLPRTQVLQTDAAYQPAHFAPRLVEELYAFVGTLREWPRAKRPGSGEAVNYIALVSFKLTDGQVVAVLP
ncbi:hypothetical protein DLM85_16285 [Hymenobacter edaphi]|uniref:TonB C-terminal domain-containing protein n=2 Tax=Hymenobacter edaphi TaxID=2211146 RepID=A0A328BF47_9BACT|nr:hypothetical protein DLM85_16285 [Hymenobacter edaphi]